MMKLLFDACFGLFSKTQIFKSRTDGHLRRVSWKLREFCGTACPLFCVDYFLLLCHHNPAIKNNLRIFIDKAIMVLWIFGGK